MTDDPPPIVARDDGTVVVSGAAVPLLYRAVHALAIRQHRDGLAPPPLLAEARTALFRAATSRRRHRLDETPPTTPCCDGHDSAYVDSAAAAELLGLSRRQALRLAANGLDAVRCGSIWLFPRGAVMTLAARRKATS